VGVFDGVVGAAAIEPAHAVAEFGWLLAADERLHHGYRLVREAYLFTDHRLMVVRRLGTVGRRIDCHSVPYRAVQRFRVRTAGVLRPYAVLTIWAGGQQGPTLLQFGRGVDMYDLHALLSQHVGR
jgi:hypothetical protein